MPRPTVANAVTAIEKHGALLLFPVNNRPEPLSLWHCFFGDKPMDWDWSEDGTDDVPRLWHLRTELSLTREVIYSKWCQGRATFFARDLFTAVLSHVSVLANPIQGLSSATEQVYRVLTEDSPLPTKELRKRSELEGRFNEPAFNKALKQLWSRLLIVGYGEVEEGGFPSLAVGATSLIFEDLWEESRAIDAAQRAKIISQYLKPKSALFRSYQRMIDGL